MKSLPGSVCLGLLLLAGSGLALPVAADDVTLTGVSSFASIDGSAQDHDGLANGVFTVDDGNLVIDGTVSCNDDPPKPGYANACPMRFVVSGNMTIEAGGVLSAENRIGGGNGGNITLEVGGNLLLRGATPGLPGALVSGSRLTGTHHPAGRLTFTVGGDVAFEKGSILDTGTIASPSGAISITAGGAIEVNGLVASGPGRTVLATKLTGKVLDGGNSGQGGGAITLRSASAGGSGIRVEADGIVVSQGEGPGAGTVILEACGIEIRGLVASVSRANGPTQVLVRSGSEILVDGRDLGAADTTLTRRGRVRADATRRSALTHGVDLFAQGGIEVRGPEAPATLFAVSSLPGANNKTIPGGMIRAYSLDGTLTASGNAFETGRPTTGNKGGTIDLRSRGDALLDSATLKAMGGGQGGTIAVRSYQGDISWMFGVGDARLIGTGASAAAQGAIQLTACGTVNVTGTQFPTNGSPIPPFPVITAGVCSPAAPVLPADQSPLPVCETNDAPVADDQSVTTGEDTPVDITLTGSDPDGDPLTFMVIDGPTSGVLSGTPPNVTYTPNSGFVGTDSFTFKVNDGNDDSAPATVTITVTEGDAPPVAVDDAATVGEDAPATTIDVLANDTDPDGGPKSIASVTQPANGSVVITNSGTDLTYQPNPNYCNSSSGSPDTFTYALSPGGSSATVSVTVTCVDDPPTAVNDAATVPEDAPATPIDVLANDTDGDSGPKSVASVTQPANGSVVITGGGTSLTYQPNPNYCNTQVGGVPSTFTYTLTPGGSTATVSVTVTCLNDPPVANPETFEFIGNTELRVDLAAISTPHALETTPSDRGVLHNDTDHPTESDPLVLSGIVGCADDTAPFVCVLPGTGTVTLESDGSFSFVPEPGDTGASESFQYILSDGQATANGTVTLNRFHRVWYVRNDADAGGLGRSGDPFDTLGEAEDASLANDYIFVYSGDGTSSGHTEGIALKNGQHLIGHHAGLSLDVDLNDNGAPTHLVAAAPGNRPVLDDTTIDAVQGVAATDAVPASIVGLSLGGHANAIDLTTTSGFASGGTLTIRDNVIRGAANEGVDVNLAGSGAVNLAFHGNNLTAIGTALDIQETGAGTLTITAFHNNVVSGDTAGSGLVVSGARFDAVPGGGVDLVSGGATVIGAPGDSVGGAGLILIDATGGLSFADLDVFAGGGAALQASGGLGGFQLAVNPAVAIIEATGGPAVNVSNAAINLPLSSLKSTNSASTGVSLATVTGSFSAGAGSSITSNTGRAFQVDGSNLAASYAGTITNNGTGVSLTNNPGSTIAFTGAMALSTGTNAAFTATGSGTVTSTSTASTLATTTGTALNVTNTTIGASHLMFRSVSANGAANGIILNNTGASGGLKIVGNSGLGTGGTIQNTSSHGVSLISTQGVALTSLNVLNTGAHGIHASGVNGMTVTGGQVSNTGNGDNEHGLNLLNVTGTVTVDAMSFSNAAEDLIHLDNTNAHATVNVVNGSSFSHSGIGGFTNDAILLHPNGNSALTVNVQGATFTNIRGDAVQIAPATSGSNGTSNLTVSNNTMNVTLSGRANSVTISGQELARTNVNIASNVFNGAGGNGVIGVDANDSSTVAGTISGNNIQNPPGIGIFIAADEAATTLLVVDGNTVTNSGGDGIELVNFGGAGVSTTNLVITNNQVNGNSLAPAQAFLGGIAFVGFEDNTCLVLRGNTVTGTPASPTACGGAPCADYYVEEVGGATVLEEMPNTAATTASAAYVQSINNPAGAAVTLNGIIDLSNGTQCPRP